MAAKYFQDADGNDSSSRLTAFIVVMGALVFAAGLMTIGCIIAIHEMTVSSLVAAAAAAGTEFGVIAGGAMFYMWGQKKSENEVTMDKT